MSYIIYQQQQPVVWISEGPAFGPKGNRIARPPTDKETLRLNHNRWGWLRDSNDRDFEVGLSVIRRNRSLKRLDLSGLLWKQHGQTMPFNGTTNSNITHGVAVTTIGHHRQHETSAIGRLNPQGTGGAIISPRTIRFLETLQSHSTIEEVQISQGQGHPLQPYVLCPLLRIPTLKKFHLKDGLSTISTKSKQWSQFAQAIGDNTSLETLFLHKMDVRPTLSSSVPSSHDKAASGQSILNSLLHAIQCLPRLTDLSLSCDNDSPMSLDGDARISLGRILAQSTITIINNNSSNTDLRPSLKSLELLHFQLYDHDLDLLGRSIQQSSLSSSSSSRQDRCVTLESLTLGTVIIDHDDEDGGRTCKGLMNFLTGVLHPTSSLRKLVIHYNHRPTDHVMMTRLQQQQQQQLQQSSCHRRHHHQSSDQTSWEDMIPDLVRQNYQLEELRLPYTVSKRRDVQRLVDIYLELNRGGRRRLLRSLSTTQTEWVRILADISTSSSSSSSSSDHSLDLLYLALRENPRFLETHKSN